ncbi:MAG: acyltransferase family protein, partial [Henriciella sp.]|uniref:acyltransferase family protein n=1 Tax=Henriciella sp. TaxID=1968823 RepID=UPI003C7735EC
PTTDQTRPRHTLDYRPDIDGLRAVAILAVLVFHLGFASLEGGFLGVDVFFVISGFLITAIIEKRDERKTFTFKDFYFGRVRRLFPAMLATVIATLIAAVAIMTPDDLMRFTNSGLGAVLSVSNFVFYAEAGYWDTASELKPLLHTWSLGVEEQFYLCWPALLLLIFRMFRRAAWLAMLLITVAGIVLSEWMIRVDPSAAFYLFPFRVFEFSMGALVLYLSRSGLWKTLGSLNGVRDFVFVLGLIVTLGSIWLLGGETPFPGLNALPVVMGAGAMILASAGEGKRVVAPLLLSNPVAVWIGRVSYSMYLVHWPIIALYRYQTGSELILIEQAGLAAATLFATLLLHYGVERRFRYRTPERPKREPLSPTAFAFSTFAVCYACTLVFMQIQLNQGWSWRFEAIALTPEQIEAGNVKRRERTQYACRIRDYGASPDCDEEKPIQILVYGDSHETDGYNFLASAYGARRDINVTLFGSINDCSDLKKTGNRWVTSSDRCSARLDRLFDESFMRNIDIMVYSGSRPYSADKGDIVGILETLKERFPDVRIVTHGGLLVTKIHCSRLVNEAGSLEACLNEEQVEYFEDEPGRYPYFGRVMAISAAFIDRVDLLCPGREVTNCIASPGDGIPMMYDRTHLSLEYAERSGRLFARENPRFLDDVLAQPANTTVASAQFTD